MIVRYNNVDITESIDFNNCIFDSYSGKRADMLDIKIKDQNDNWDKYNPKIGDSISVERDGVKTGEMVIKNLIPESGKYRIISTSMPLGWNTARYSKWNRITFKQLIRNMARRYNLEYEDYSANDRIYPYLCQDYENDFEFMQKLAVLEDNAIIVKNGKLIIYGISVLENAEVNTVIETDNSNRPYFFRNPAYGECTTIYNNMTATFTARSGPELRKKIEIQVDSIGTLEKYAENILKDKDRENETGTFVTNTLMSNISAGSVAVLWSNKDTFNGRIFIEHIRHDLKNNKSKIFFRRVVDYGTA